jgi:hypothetical protein
MSCVAGVLTDDRTVTVALSVTEKIQALHGDLAVPRTGVVRARAAPAGLAEVHGPDMPTGWPAVSTVGTVRDFDRVTFAVCYGRQPAVVLDLAGLLAWAAGTDENGLNVVTVWESEAHKDRWTAEQLFPVFQALGLADVPSNTENTGYNADEFYIR